MPDRELLETKKANSMEIVLIESMKSKRENLKKFKKAPMLLHMLLPLLHLIKLKAKRKQNKKHKRQQPKKRWLLRWHLRKIMIMQHLICFVLKRPLKKLELQVMLKLFMEQNNN
jgi:hypothetical protein